MGRKQFVSCLILYKWYTDDVLSINKQGFENYLGQIHPVKHDIKDTTENKTSASYLDLLLLIVREGQLHTSIYNKRDEFNFHITKYLILGSNIPSSLTYGVFISQLIRSQALFWGQHDFPISDKGYVEERLILSLKKCYGRFGDLIKQY